MTYLEVECKVEAIETLGDPSLMDLEESLWEGKLIIEFKLRAIFSLSLQQKRLFFDLIYGLGSGLAYVCVCPKEQNLVSKRIEQKAKWKCETVEVQLRKRRQYRQQKEGSVGERDGRRR